MTKTKSAYLALITVLLSPFAASADPIVTADAVYEDSSGRQWIEIFETAAAASWNDVASVCDAVTGKCSGILDRHVSRGDLDMTGLVWASNDEVAELFYETAGLPPGSLDDGYEEGRAAEVALFGSFFRPTYQDDSGRDPVKIYHGYTRTLGQPLVGGVDDLFALYRGLSCLDCLDVIGGWFFYAPVPEPGTLALLTLGLLGMGAARRRKKA